MGKSIKMGWLFGKKKSIPQGPIPGGPAFDEKVLRFPTTFPSAKIIRPEELKRAAGFEKKIVLPQEEEDADDSQQAEELHQPIRQQRFERSLTREPLYIKMNVYQRILGDLDTLKTDFSFLQEANRRLENSEFNEENNFEKLKKIMRNVHDRILIADKVLFKGQGE